MCVMSNISDKHPIEGLMASAMSGLKNMIDVNTIVGDPITTPDGTVIMPISKVSLGFGVGGSEYMKKRALIGSGETEPANLFGGGTGGGISLSPVGFLVVGGGTIRMVSVSEENSIYDRIFDAVPVAIDKITELYNEYKKNKDGALDVDAEDIDDDYDYTDLSSDDDGE